MRGMGLSCGADLFYFGSEPFPSFLLDGGETTGFLAEMGRENGRSPLITLNGIEGRRRKMTEMNELGEQQEKIIRGSLPKITV
jgi:hypothetical protein